VSAPLTATFGGASNTPFPEKKAKPTAPYSIRFTAEERSRLEAQAGHRSLGAYIRDKLLGEQADKRCRALRKPSLGDEQFAALLAALGDSHLSSNLNQLAKHANMGTLDVSEDVEKELHYAYEAIIAMREALFIALGLKSGGGR